MVLNNYDRDIKIIHDGKVKIAERNIRENKDNLKQAETTLGKLDKDLLTLGAAKEEAEAKYDEAAGYYEEAKEAAEQSNAEIAKAEAELEELKKKLSRD